MLEVYITIDTETLPRTPNWRDTNLQTEIERDIYGRTTEGEYGVEYQMQVLNAHGLRAVFFVESLFPCVTGLEPLRKLVALIHHYGHDVQLHIHTEWLEWISPSPVQGRLGKNIKDFSEADQTVLIATGLRNLRAAVAC